MAGLEPTTIGSEGRCSTNWTTPPTLKKLRGLLVNSYTTIGININKLITTKRLLVTRTGIKPVMHAWKACVLIASPTGPLLIRIYKFFQLMNIHASAGFFYHFTVAKKKKGRHWANRKLRPLCYLTKFFCINF